MVRHERKRRGMFGRHFHTVRGRRTHIFSVRYFTVLLFENKTDGYCDGLPRTHRAFLPTYRHADFKRAVRGIGRNMRIVAVGAAAPALCYENARGQLLHLLHTP